MSKGWIKLYRKIQDNPLWTAESFSRGQAWVDLILLANHKEGYIYVRDNKITIKRGQVGWSQKRLANRWGWSRTKVRSFLKDLEEEQQIKQHKSTVSTVITLINYEEYQGEKQQDGQQRNSRKTAEVQQKNTNKNVKNVNNDNKTPSTSDSGESDKESRTERLARLNNMDLELAKTPLEKLSTDDFKIPKDKSSTDERLNYLTMAFFEALPDEVRGDNRTKQKKFVKWRNNIRLMHMEDKRTLNEIQKGIKYFKQDSFWRGEGACQSTAGFRKHYLRIVQSGKRKSEGKKQIPSKDGFDAEKARRDLASLEFD